MSVVKKAFLLGISVVILLVFCMSAFIMPKNAKATVTILPEIQNDGFEQADNLGWQITAENIDAQNHGLTSEVFYDGVNSYQLKQNHYVIKSVDFINIDLNSEYVFGIKFFSTELDNTCKISVDAFDQNGEYLYTADGETVYTKIKDVWQDVNLFFEKSQNATKIKIKIEVNSTSGQVCIDNVYGHKNFVQMLDGASINLETTPSALENFAQLRFTGKMDKSVYQQIKNSYASVSVGIMLIPTKAIESVGEFAVKALNTPSLLVKELTKWSNEYTLDVDDFYLFDYALTLGKSVDRLKLDISVRVFVKFNVEGQERYVYSEYSEEKNSRSVYSVAVKAKADTENFKLYSEEQKEKINAYIEGREPNIEN